MVTTILQNECKSYVILALISWFFAACIRGGRLIMLVIK